MSQQWHTHKFYMTYLEMLQTQDNCIWKYSVSTEWKARSARHAAKTLTTKWNRPWNNRMLNHSDSTISAIRIRRQKVGTRQLKCQHHPLSKALWIHGLTSKASTWIEYVPYEMLNLHSPGLNFPAYCSTSSFSWVFGQCAILNCSRKSLKNDQKCLFFC